MTSPRVRNHLAEMLRMYFTREELTKCAALYGVSGKDARETAALFAMRLLASFGAEDAARRLTIVCPSADWYWVLGISGHPQEIRP